MSNLHSNNVQNGTRLRERFSPTIDNKRWLEKMELRGVSKNSIINMAIDILRPRLDNVGATDTSVAEVLLLKKIEENNLKY